MIGETLGNYRIVAKIGSGAMGDVFLAEHQRIVRRAAIKVLNQELTTNPQLVARFLDEARATSLIHHPGIVEVFDCDVDPGGRVYLVMEYLEGQTLAARLEAEGRLAWPIACGLARQVALALGAAHRKGIIHRDIKPENIFLPASPSFPAVASVKVLDFGIAKLVSKDPAAPHRTVPGVLIGTPHYMPPEQCDGDERLDLRADIYALGCLLFRMISGRLPFVGSQVRDVLAAQTFRRPPPLGPANPPTPGWLDALVARMLAKQPSQRPGSMEDVARVLERASRRGASGAPIRIGPTFSFGLIAVCGVALLGGGLLAARATMGRRGRPGSPRASAVIAQASAPPAATRVLAPVAELAPDAAGDRAIVTGTAPVHPQPAPPPSALRRPRARRAQPAVEMDGLVDL